jgi:DnaJ-domain-containing protein 1
MSTITLDPSGALKVQTPYNAAFVAGIKMIPVTARKFDPTSKAWLVDPAYAGQVASLIEKHLGEVVLLPQIVKGAPRATIEIFEVHYIGMTKERGEQQRSAFGFVNGEWSIIFNEDVLRAWFDQSAMPGDETNLYMVLSVSQLATPDVIKQNYRRLARQWHPDVCKEPDAQTRFIEIQHAYEILSDTRQRAKYDAGLALQSFVKPSREASRDFSTGYRTPLRCGLITASGLWTLGRFTVTKILNWEDIVNRLGQTLVVSWPAGAEAFLESWV